jgi:hypothetical protein
MILEIKLGYICFSEYINGKLLAVQRLVAGDYGSWSSGRVAEQRGGRIHP